MLGLWHHYRSLHSQCAMAVVKLEERADHLLKSATDISEEENSAWMKDCNVRRDAAKYFTTESLNAETLLPLWLLEPVKKL